MSVGNPKRTRSELVSVVSSAPGPLTRLAHTLRRGDVLLRLLVCFFAACLMWAITGAWAPPFAYRTGYIPPRNIAARVAFSRPNPRETDLRRAQARREAVLVYKHDVQPLVEVRRALKDRMLKVLAAESYEKMTPEEREVWSEFLNRSDMTGSINEEQLFNDVREAFASDMQLAGFEQAIQKVLADHERDGLLLTLEHSLEEGSQLALQVHPVGNESFTHRVDVKDVRIAEATADLLPRLTEQLKAAKLPDKHVEAVAVLVFQWLKPRLPTTLSLNKDASERARQEAMMRVPEATIDYKPGDKLADAGLPLNQRDWELLRAEHRQMLQDLPWTARVRHSLADLGMYAAFYLLCGSYLFYRAPRILADWRRFFTLLGLVVFTIAACKLVSHDQWRAEIVPLTLVSMTWAIAYERELALLLSAGVSLVASLSLGHGLAEFVILLSSGAAAILLTGRIRSRTKLIYVGFGIAAVSSLTALGVGTLVGQTFGISDLPEFSPFVELDETFGLSYAIRALIGASWYAFCGLTGGVLMTGLLPFVEKLMDVQTDISLLELGDAAHPLLQELVRRAPGTYNHSINVASLAEAAAESIGANGLLVRVGAYFHDIGKMLKPAYFVENQGQTGNRHDSLLPAMSTLVIIAHVKDGADLARQHGLPQSIIDFIEQHHGTTLVEYFYRAATRRSEGEGGGGEVDEGSFRYPGPKPQTKEAAVLMIADAVEGASRTLVDPAPSRLENLVNELAMKRLLDGQFEECGLTLSELNAVCDSIAKSLIAVYHGRVKYPSQQSA